MPAADILEGGGKMHGFQIWVNLPKDKKLSQPRYQEYGRDKLPEYRENGRWVRVIAGEADGRRSPIETTVPTTMLHVRLEPNAAAVFDIAPGSNAIVHAIAGSGSVLDRALNEHEVALVEGAPTKIALTAGAAGLELLLLAGVPLHEPVARYGPFVMNTREEVQRAFEDFQAGRFGEIARVH